MRARISGATLLLIQGLVFFALIVVLVLSWLCDWGSGSSLRLAAGILMLLLGNVMLCWIQHSPDRFGVAGGRGQRSLTCLQLGIIFSGLGLLCWEHRTLLLVCAIVGQAGLGVFVGLGRVKRTLPPADPWN